MPWIQSTNPFNSIALSAIVAVIPIVFLFLGFACFKIKGHIVGIFTVVITVLIATIFFSMPSKYALLSTLYGILFGLWPIGWIVLTAVFLYNLTVKSGQFSVIKNTIANITDDRRLQAILIAFSFGAFLEGCAGFGVPVAITAAMLVGLGFKPMYAAGICLIANTAPVAFGAVGIPVITAGAVSNIDPMVVSQIVGRQLLILAAFVPFWLVFILSGWKGARQVMPAILVSGFSFAITQWLTSNYLNPMLPNIISSIVSIIALVILLKFWKPESSWKFPDEKNIEINKTNYSFKEILLAWSPFIVLTILISDWALKPVKNLLDTLTLNISFTGLNEMLIINGEPLSVVFKFDWLSAAGTSILISAIISALILKISFKKFCSIFLNTLKDLRFALITIACFLGFAYVANWSGMTTALGKAFIATGAMFPFISPFLGWIGVFITGSDTSSNALFCNMQRVTAESMGMNPVLTVGANSTGGVAAKMISPQSLVVATSSTGLTGQEGNLFRFTLPHSLFFGFLIAIITLIQAYVFPWMIPEISNKVVTTGHHQGGGIYILILTVVLIGILRYIVSNNKTKPPEKS